MNVRFGSPAAPDRSFEAEVLEPWRKAGRPLIEANWSTLQDLIGRIDELIARRLYAEAAVAAQVAANHAVQWHPGCFASGPLEERLLRIGRAALDYTHDHGSAREAARPWNVLHVATRVAGAAGHVRMMSRWIQNDDGNRHSVALTRQFGPVPPMLTEAVSSGGGQLTLVNRRAGGFLHWARCLQELLAQADVVVLHVHNMDVVPFLALAGMRNRPRVILLNHADHLFWLGVRFADLVASTRRSGLELCLKRRGIDASRNHLFALCLDAGKRKRSREEAKRALGLPPDSLVLLSIARGSKFRSVAGEAFADPLVPLLKSDPRLRLVAVGPGGQVDWSDAETEVPGRILCLPERSDVSLYREAADIYLDSFPFVSITSLFEAGLYGLPLVTRDAFGPGCRIFGADSPGLDGHLLRCATPAELRDTIRRLAADPTLRETLGSETRREIEAKNMGSGWQQSLQEIYSRLFSLPPLEDPGPVEEDRRHEDIDLFSPFIYGDARFADTPATRLAFCIETEIKAAPLAWRLQALADLARLVPHEGRPALVRSLLPEWVGTRIRDAMSRP